MTCDGIGKTFKFNIPVVFKYLSDPYASATGDPHFKQPVIDEITGSVKHICYDVIGEAGDYLYK